MALLVRSVEAFQDQLAQAGDKPVVVAFIPMTCSSFAEMYGKTVQACKHSSGMVFLLVMVDCGPAAKEIADKCGVVDTPTFQYYMKSEKVSSFSDPEAQDLLKSLEGNLSQSP